MSSIVGSSRGRRQRDLELQLELVAAKERLEAVTVMVVQLRRAVRRASPLDVPALTGQLHLIEAVAAGKRPWEPAVETPDPEPDEPEPEPEDE